MDADLSRTVAMCGRPKYEAKMTLRSLRFARFLFVALTLAVPATLWAQTVDVGDVIPQEEHVGTQDQVYLLHTGYSHQFESDVNGGGDVSNNQFMAGIGGRFKLSDSLSFSPRFVYSLDAYDISNGAAANPPVQPEGFNWGNINQYTVLGLLNWQIDEKWSLLGGPIFRLAGEGSESWDKDAFTGGGIVGFLFKPDDKFQVGLALGVMSQLADDAGLVPIPMIRWNFAEDWNLKMGIDQLGGRTGVGPEINWSFTKDWDLGLGFQFQRKRYRLDDHGGNARHIGEDSGLPIYLRVGFHPTKELMISAFGGVVAGGELRTQDVGGDHTFDRGYDTAGTLGLQASYTF